MTQLKIDLTDPKVLADPGPTYDILRAKAPVYHIEDDDIYVISRYKDARMVLRDHERFSSEAMGRIATAGLGRCKREGDPLSDAFAENLEKTRNVVTSDPPDHTKMRRFLSKRFTPKRISAWAEKVEGLADELLDEMIQANQLGKADLAAQYAYSIPLIIIAEMLAVPYELRAKFRTWSDMAIGIFSGAPLTQEVQEGCLGLTFFFAEQVQQRRQDPSGDDLISLLIQQNPDDDSTLDDGEIVQTCTLLLIAGHETTANLILNTSRALWLHPEQRARLEHDPSLIPAAIEEALRWDGPVQAVYRSTTCDVEVAGTHIPKGKVVLVQLGAANRDEAQFPDANRFDIDREITEHLAFGSGNHFCLGSHLSRIEGRIAMEALLRRTRNLRPNGEPVRAAGNILRGYSSMPVAFDVV